MADRICVEPLVAALLFSACLVASEASASRPPISDRMTRLRQSVLALHGQIESIDVSCTVRDASVPANDAISFSQHRLRAMGMMRYAENKHTNPPFSAEMDLNHTVQVFANGVLTVYYPKWEFVEICRTPSLVDRYAQKILDDDVMRWIGWWPLAVEGHPPLEDAMRFSYVRYLCERENATIEEDTHDVNGHECIVLKAGDERVWLDPSLGYAIRRRERWSDDRSADYLIQTSDDLCSVPVTHQESGKLLWYPRSISISAGRSNVQDGADRLLTISIDSLVVNVCTIDDFRFEPPVGAIVSDRDTGKVSLIKGTEGIAFLEKTIELAAAFMAIESKEQRAVAGGGRRTRTLLVLSLVGVLVLVVTSCLIARRRQCRGCPDCSVDENETVIRVGK